ncbi:MAG TPA: hypothetical protein VFR67_05105 [Pilimelia sp.]|nr:hypothetical protein [Pilimelia sp.]
MCAGLLNLHCALVLAVSMAAAVRGRRLAGGWPALWSRAARNSRGHPHAAAQAA